MIIYSFARTYCPSQVLSNQLSIDTTCQYLHNRSNDDSICYRTRTNTTVPESSTVSLGMRLYKS